MEKISYGGWENCFRLTNEIIEIILTADVGPRIIRFALYNGDNVFKEYQEQLGQVKSDEWISFGGHRLWHAPESIPRTYFPDMESVLVQPIDSGLIATQKPEPTTGLQKQIEIILSKDKPEVFIKHILINHNLWTIETAPWAISVMNPGGTAVLPLPPRGTHPDYLLPSSSLIIWPYTDLSDNCFIFGNQVILIKQDSAYSLPQKLGIYTSEGWAAYANQNCLFIKQVPFQFDGIYPDLGANFEIFTNQEMLEVESLGPLEIIPPKGQVIHQEHWTLIDGIPTPESEEDVIKYILPHL